MTLTNLFIVGFRNYLVKSFKTAVAVSRIPILKQKLFTKYHQINDIENTKYKQIASKYFTKFHRSFYKDHILELANDLSTEEQEVASEVQAEPEIYKFDNITEDSEINTLDDLIELENEPPDVIIIPDGSRVIQIIVNSGIIAQKTYLSPTGETILITF